MGLAVRLWRVVPSSTCWTSLQIESKSEQAGLLNDEVLNIAITDPLIQIRDMRVLAP